LLVVQRKSEQRKENRYFQAGFEQPNDLFHEDPRDAWILTIRFELWHRSPLPPRAAVKSTAQAACD
jgi:hypothetical protein